MTIPVSQRLEVLTQQIIRSRVFYDLWWFTAGAESRPKIVDALNELPVYFRFNEHAHFVAMIIHSANVFDTTRSTISLPRLARDVLDPSRYEAHQEIAAEVGRLRDTARGILKIRNNAIAHRSELDGYSEVFKQAGVIPGELPTMMASWLDLVNELRQIHGMECDKVTGEPDFNNLPLRDLQRLIHKLGGPDLRPKSSLADIFKP